MIGIWLIRSLAVFAALMLSRAQFTLFDCNKMPGLSVLSGMVTLLLVYAMGEALYRIAMSDYDGKLRSGAIVVLGGGVLVGGAGFFTMVTHMCP